MLGRTLPFLVLLAAAPALADGGAPVICVDPGHGGKQEGAVGPGNRREKDVALQVGKLVAQELKSRLGARVVMTRERDEEVDLEERVRIANEAGADVFVSIHCNSMPTSRARRLAHGMETYFLSAEASGDAAKAVVARENAEQKKKEGPTDALSFILNDLARTQAHRDASRLAYAVHQKMTGQLDATDRGVHQAPFVVLMGAEMPAILVELGYISHEQESKLLTDKAYQQRLARALTDGIEEFLTLVGRRTGPETPPARAESATDAP
ncbi:MAG: N-acetylmuramoyl-L-alanine amidase [Myxococcales bacterium]